MNVWGGMPRPLVRGLVEVRGQLGVVFLFSSWEWNLGYQACRANALPAEPSGRPKAGFHPGQWGQSSSEVDTEGVSSVLSAPAAKTDSAVLRRPYPASSE